MAHAVQLNSILAEERRISSRKLPRLSVTRPRPMLILVNKVMYVTSRTWNTLFLRGDYPSHR